MTTLTTSSQRQQFFQDVFNILVAKNVQVLDWIKDFKLSTNENVDQYRNKGIKLSVDIVDKLDKLSTKMKTTKSITSYEKNQLNKFAYNIDQCIRKIIESFNNKKLDNSSISDLKIHLSNAIDTVERKRQVYKTGSIGNFTVNKNPQDQTHLKQIFRLQVNHIWYEKCFSGIEDENDYEIDPTTELVCNLEGDSLFIKEQTIEWNSKEKEYKQYILACSSEWINGKLNLKDKSMLYIPIPVCQGGGLSMGWAKEPSFFQTFEPHSVPAFKDIDKAFEYFKGETLHTKYEIRLVKPVKMDKEVVELNDTLYFWELDENNDIVWIKSPEAVNFADTRNKLIVRKYLD